MEHLLIRVWDDLLGRLTGPLEFRLYLQPAMAVLYAVRDGRRDARAGRMPYLWTLMTRAEERKVLLCDGWKSVARLYALAVCMDVLYQLLALSMIYPGEALIVSFFLALIPYLLLRGPVNRFWRLRHEEKGS